MSQSLLKWSGSLCVLLLANTCVCLAQNGRLCSSDEIDVNGVCWENRIAVASDAAGSPGQLPDAPSAVSRCNRATMTDAGIHYEVIPCPTGWHTIPEQKPAVNFFSFRKRWQDSPLRTNAQMFHSKVYLASVIGGAVAMVVACRNPRSGEDWGSEVPAVLGVDAMSFFAGRLFTMPFAVAPGAWEMIHYSRAATK